MARPRQGLWKWLDATGILQWGTEEDIKAAKKLYRRAYQRAYKRKKREKRPEVTVSLTKDEHSYLTHMAKTYEMTLSQLLAAATLAYFNQVYLVAKPHRVARLEQILATYHNQFKQLAADAQRKGNDPAFKLYGTFANHFVKIEESISQYLRYPYSLDKILKEAIATKPAFRAKLQAYLNNRP